MKKISYILTTFILFFMLGNNVLAREIAVVNGTEVRFRTSMNTDITSNIIAAYDYGVELDLLDANAGSTSSCSIWYKVRNGNIVGYICGEFVIIRTVEDEITDPGEYQDYSDYLRGIGFPESYIERLLVLHNAHPSWQFSPYNVPLDFAWMVEVEYNGYSEGWSLFEDTGRYYDGYKATDSWAYDYRTDYFRSNYVGGGINRWYAPNREMLGYYIDPRNFLNDSQVFMFETLSFNETYHTKAGVEAMLNNTFMTGMVDETHTYADAFIDAARTYNVSPYVLVSRVIQEVGTWGSVIVSGTVPGYEGYYNFYNIQAYGSSDWETICNGLNHAKASGWDSKYNAIVGGAAFLANGYINAGQDTLYSQKWDIVPPNYITHQYMQNIQAPASEAYKTYSNYNNLGLINNEFMFLIPVYQYLPASTSMPNSGNPNNYLSYLKINDYELINVASEDTYFFLTLPNDTQTVHIEGTTVNGRASISGLGDIPFNTYTKELHLIVTAENQTTREYIIVLSRENAFGLGSTFQGEPSLNDVLYFMKHYLGIGSNQNVDVASGDTNGDGVITLVDIVTLLRVYLGVS